MSHAGLACQHRSKLNVTYFEIGTDRLPVVARRLDAGEARGAPSADQGERGEESQQPPESESRTGWTPLPPPPEEDPRETHAATGEASVQVTAQR